MFHNNVLKPARQRLFKGKIYGFDIETYNKNKSFLCASIFFDKNNKWVFYDKQKLIDFLKTKRFRNSHIVATNLSFDFFGTFYNTKEVKNFQLLFRGSSLIYAKTFIRGKNFHKTACLTKKVEGKTVKIKGKQGERIVFIDTTNYAQMSVEKLGQILKLPKLEHPKFLGKKPKNKKQWDEMILYNLRDSEISKMYMEFLYKSFAELGASHKLTISSTAMSLFRNKYMKFYDVYYRHEPDELLEIFKAYYGGRTEAFSRGLIKDYNYYDFNSLYPDVMRNKFPNPNAKRITYKNNLEYIKKYEGVSDVDVFCPDMKYPFLPYRTKDKLMFPVGKFRGWHSHVELRKCLTLGYKILKVYKTYYYKYDCEPFKDYVSDNYKLRKKFVKEKNPMEQVVKLLMNSLYGKFGQKFIDRDEWQPFNHTLEELNKLKFFERHGDFIRIKKDFTEPSAFCIPIWALYVTAYGRIKIYDAVKKSDAIYCDTDSIVTKSKLKTSDELGDLKLEMKIRHGIIVKPKFYAVVDSDRKEFVKIKGLGKRLTFNEFNRFLKSPKITYMKFMKFKESIRRGFIPNEIIDMIKKMDLEDNKRQWVGKFDPKVLNSSSPILVKE